jgi:predicted nuclease of predicted toxin-antitoxin system
MRVLLDTCVWGGVRTELEIAGFIVEWVGDWNRDPGDEEIIKYAFQNECILITLDKDFGELVFVFHKPHKGIVRLVNLSARNQGKLCLHILHQYGKELMEGAIITVSPNRTRIRPPD